MINHKQKNGATLWVCLFKTSENNQSITRNIPPTAFTLLKDTKKEDWDWWKAEQTLGEFTTLPKKMGKSELQVFETEAEARKYYNDCIDSAADKAIKSVLFFKQFTDTLYKCKEVESKQLSVKI